MSGKNELIVAIARRWAIYEAMGKEIYPKKRPLLTLEQFFLHSAGEADLWYNIIDRSDHYPSSLEQYDFHRRIRERADVWDVLISITQLDDDPEYEPSTEEDFFVWPNSDHTLIVTTADEAEIRSWFPENIQPDEINIEDRTGAEWATPAFVPKGYHQAWLWYD